MYGECPLFNNGVLHWLHVINIPALLPQAPSFTNNVYLGQVETSVSVGNLHNYITQLPNLLLQKDLRYFFLGQKGGTATLPHSYSPGLEAFICMTMPLKRIFPPPCWAFLLG